MKILIFLMMFIGFPLVCYAQIKVVDGDSFFIGKKEIRLSGIDAPEYFQDCYDANGKKYACGKKAKEALVELIGPDLVCDKLLTDKYKREVAVCYSKGENINKKMVEIGWAVAYKRYTDEYNEAEKLAKKNKKGVWQGRFLKPEFYRILNK